MIDEKHDHLEAMSCVSQAFADLGREDGAGILVMANFFRPTRVMHQKGDIHRDRIFHLLEDLPEEFLLGVVRVDQAVEDVDAAQGVLVGGVAMKEFMLDEVGQFPEFRDISSEKSVSMHSPEDVSDLSSGLQDFFEGFAIGTVSAEVPVYEVPVQFEESTNIRARTKMSSLGVQEEPHQPLRILLEDVVVLRIDETSPRIEAVENFLVGCLASEEVENGNSFRVIADHLEFEALHQGGAVVKEVLGVPIVVPHEGLTLPKNVLTRDLEIRRHDSLQAQRQDVTGPPFLRIVKFVSNLKEELERLHDLVVGDLGKPPFFDQSLEVARFPKHPEHPDQVVVVSKSAASLFHIGLLEVDRASVFFMAGSNVAAPLAEIAFFVPPDAVFEEFTLELVEKLLVPHDKSGVEKGCLGLVILVRELAGLLDRANRVAHVEPKVEEKKGELIDELLETVVQLVTRTRDEELEVDVATWVEVSSPIASTGDQGDGGFVPCFLHGRGLPEKLMENICQERVHQGGSLSSDFHAACSTPVKFSNGFSPRLEELAIDRQSRGLARGGL